MRRAVRITRQAISPRLAIRIFLNTPPPAVDHECCCGEPNSGAGNHHDSCLLAGLSNAALNSKAITDLRQQQRDGEENRAPQRPHEKYDDAPTHSAASSIGGRLWPSTRSTSSAASARLVPGPKIACTPAARSGA